MGAAQDSRPEQVACMDASKQLADSQDVATKVTMLYQKRMKLAQQHYAERVQKAYKEFGALAAARPAQPMDAMAGWFRYGIDFAQRSVLFWDTLRQRGNNFIEHTQRGLPPVLSFEYDMIADGRRFERAVNYALVEIKPPQGVTVDAKRRPYVIIDPRAGHGPGIGGF